MKTGILGLVVSLLAIGCADQPLSCDIPSARTYAERRTADLVTGIPTFSDSTETFVLQRGDTFTVEGWMDSTARGATNRSEYHVKCLCDSGRFELVERWVNPGPGPFDHDWQ